MLTRTKWIAALGVVLSGAMWVSARGDDCDGGSRIGFGRSWRHGEGYSYRSYEPGGYTGGYTSVEPQQSGLSTTYQDEYRPNGGSGPARFEEPRQSAEMRGMRTRPLRSTAVRLNEGGDVGRIEELVLSDSGCIDYMIVSFDSLPRVSGRLAAIPWNAGHLDMRNHVIMLDIARDDLFNAPIFFARGGWPDLYGSEWVAKVHSHFGLDSTRIERAYGPRDGEREDMKSRPRGKEDMKEDMNDRRRGDDLKPRPQDEGARPRPRDGLDSRDSNGIDQRTREPRGTLPENGRPAPGARDARPEAAPDRDLAPLPERRSPKDEIKSDRPLPEEKEQQ